MKIVFAGPTLFGLVRDGGIEGRPGLIVRGPAAQGAIYRAVVEGADAIGLIDGRYDDVAAPWHKEILYGLGLGVHMLGAGSLGALRAAECAAFGMIGIGEVFERYRARIYEDDADVAQLHGPEEMDYLPLSEPMVNIEATLEHLLAMRAIEPATAEAVRAAARGIFFKQLTIPAVVASLGWAAEPAAQLEGLLTRHRIDQKRIDAIALLDALEALPDARRTDRPDWQMAQPYQWRRFVSQVEASEAAASSSAAAT